MSIQPAGSLLRAETRLLRDSGEPAAEESAELLPPWPTDPKAAPARLYPSPGPAWPSRLLRGLLELLAPARAACGLCGGGFAPGRTSLAGLPADLPRSWCEGVCGRCRGMIPWISRIQCHVCGRPDPCGDCCRRTSSGFIRSRSAVRYTLEMRQLLARYKYRGEEALQPWLAEMLLPAYHALAEELRLADRLPGRVSDRLGRDGRSEAQPFDLVTSVPISRQRLEERGFNQAERLAASLAVRAGVTSRPLLERKEERGKMSAKTRRERLLAAEGLFGAAPEAAGILRLLAARDPERRRPLRLLIVDDIYTTGSTMDHCALALQRCSHVPVDLYGLTWARA
ncbi:ComF family protein [Paenibacillus albicereus]|uniref:ComF family protein n=1 Tax=Paenibacillus albicereus TaxID=2726185 RepID=A0A6H2H297_9BACL|nr:ComF family protein [Paenibacillus albicereus]QJC53782.1 ComF family protein [Paenibacillus albicereus]